MYAARNEAGIDGECLEIEITEATLMQDVQRATEVLSSLSDHGDIFELWVSSGCDLWLIFLTMWIIEVERYPPHKSE